MAEKILFRDYLEDQIRHRYSEKGLISDDNEFLFHLFDEDYYYESDKVFLNENLRLLKGDNINYNEYIPKYMYTKTFWKIMSKGLPESLNNIKSIRNKKLETIVKKVSKKGIKLCSVGYGGASTNILFNLYLINNIHKTPLFEELKIYEPDNWALSNIFRIGKPILHQAFSRFTNISGNDTIYKIQTLNLEKDLVKNKLEARASYLTEEEALKLEEEGFIFIGAPDFKTREMLERIGATFIMTGHANNSVRLTKNPVLSGGAIIETYGSIDIGVLLMNFWMATFNLLDALANKEIHKLENDTEIFKTDFNTAYTEKEIEIFKKGFTKELKTED